MFRKWHSAAAFAVLSALLIGLGCSRPDQPRDEPEDGSPLPPIEVPPEDLKALVEGNNQFAIALYKQVAAKTDGNIILSPYSISSALAMTYAGARGQTAEEMKKVLHFTLPDEKLHPAFGALDRKLHGAKDKPYKLNIANALWGQKGFSINKDFLDLTKRCYGGGYRELNFAGDSEGSRQVINRWVAEKTEDMIKELLKREENDISAQTELVLTNAIYMNATWEIPFRKEATRLENFEPSAGTAIRAPMMYHDVSQFRYARTPNLHMLELPYRGGKLAMLFVLPEKRWGLRDVENELTGDMYRLLIARLQSSIQNEVVVPRFTTRSSFDLVTALRNLGMLRAFSPSADFSGIGGGLHIEKVVHEGVVEVDEVGTVAAAATAVTMGVSYSSYKFRADQPFLFLIVERERGAILFVGRLANPNQGEQGRVR